MADDVLLHGIRLRAGYMQAEAQAEAEAATTAEVVVVDHRHATSPHKMLHPRQKVCVAVVCLVRLDGHYFVCCYGTTRCIFAQRNTSNVQSALRAHTDTGAHPVCVRRGARSFGGRSGVGRMRTHTPELDPRPRPKLCVRVAHALP